MATNSEQASPVEPVSLRSAQPADIAQITWLTRQLGYERTSEQIAASLNRINIRPDIQAVFVAETGGRVVGWIEVSLQLRLQSPPFALIGGFIVSDEMRGRGIGRQLCEAAEQWSWERGVQMLRVTSRSTRTDAHRFYLRAGFRQTKTSHVFEKTCLQ
jgi:GNAT superfamily N-acetyltransferase